MGSVPSIIKKLAAGHKNLPVVFGSGGIGLIQSLGSRGIKSLVIDDGPVTHRDYSRFCTRIHLPRLYESPLQAIESINNIFDEITRVSGNPPIIFPTSDYVLNFICEYRDKFNDLSRAVLPDIDVLKIVLNKAAFYRLLSEEGLPGPPTISLSGLSDEERKKCMDNFNSFPCVVKPAFTFKLEDIFGKKLFIANDRDELKRYCNELNEIKMDFVVQEIVKGRPDQQFSLAGYCKEDGDILAYCMTNKLRQVYFGQGTFVSSAYISELLDAGGTLLKKLDYSGIFEIEFIKDESDGTYKIIELNPRCWSQILLATRMGVNVAYLAFLDKSGCEIPDNFHAVHKKKYWINFDSDWHFHIKPMLIKKQFRWKRVIGIMSTIPVIEPFFIKDMGPGFNYLWNHIKRKLHPNE